MKGKLFLREALTKILLLGCVGGNLYAASCLVDRGEGETFLFGKHCIKKEDYYIVATCRNKLCKANLDKVTEKENIDCGDDSPGSPSPVRTTDFGNDRKELPECK